MHTVHFSVRAARQNDATEILDIDIKSFENAWPADEWARIGYEAEYAVSVLAYFGTAVGFMVCRRTPEGVQLEKIAIKTQYRGKKGSWLLIGAMEEYARKERLEVIYTVIPEHHVYPGADNLSGWLNKVGFKAISPFLKDHFMEFGEYEAGVKFVRNYRSPLQ